MSELLKFCYGPYFYCRLFPTSESSHLPYVIHTYVVYTYYIYTISIETCLLFATCLRSVLLPKAKVFGNLRRVLYDCSIFYHSLLHYDGDPRSNVESISSPVCFLNTLRSHQKFTILCCFLKTCLFRLKI